jgi:hypothetical protein
MALTATYDPLLSRIQLAATGVGGTSVYAVFDRSTDNFLSSTTVRGGARVTVSGLAAAVDDYEFPVDEPTWYRVRTYNASDVLVTTFTTGPATQQLPELNFDEVWMKVPAAPFMNRIVTITEAGDISLPARTAYFPIVGRSKDIAVSDVRPSMSYNLKIRTFTRNEELDLANVLRSAEVLYFQLAAANQSMPSGYFVAGDVSWGPPGSRARPERIFSLPLTEVAPPGADVVGSTYTWASVVADYATWSAVIADNATWADLLQRVGDPGDVIVP